MDGISDEDIRTAIANGKGSRPSLVLNQTSFDKLVGKQIEKLEIPGLQCVDYIHNEMQKIVKIAASKTPELQNFPKLLDRTMEIVNDILRNCAESAQQMISKLIQIESCYLNTDNPTFMDLMDKYSRSTDTTVPAPPSPSSQQVIRADESLIQLPPVPDQIKCREETLKDRIEVDYMKYAIKNYFQIVKVGINQLSICGLIFS